VGERKYKARSDLNIIFSSYFNHLARKAFVRAPDVGQMAGKKRNPEKGEECTGEQRRH